MCSRLKIARGVDQSLTVGDGLTTVTKPTTKHFNIPLDQTSSSSNPYFSFNARSNV